MRCASCKSENPPANRFCLQCGLRLEGRCAQCGRENPSDARFCGDCGSALGSNAASESGPARTGSELRVTPDDTEASGVQEAERKTVTAVFADIKGSTELMADLDPEEARAIIDPALKLMIDAVSRYDGYVVQSTGDGIFALFGAPVAHEDHPQRALYASLAMQENLRRYSATLAAQSVAPIEIRVGVNTGEVVVRSIQTAQGRTEYTPIGHSTNLASRVQTVAASGSIAVTEAMRRLCEGYFTFRQLEPTRVKGVSDPVNVYELTGVGPLRTRLQVSVRRGLSKFVGSETESTQLSRALELAKSGRGQIVAAVGEPGVGKSRLFYEFHSLGHQECLALEAVAVAHGKASAYLTLIDLLKNYFDIPPEEDAVRRREKIGRKVLALGQALEDTLPYLYALLEVAERDDTLPRIDPEVRRRRTLDAVKRLLLRESLNQPLILTIEDLHWIDEGSLSLVNLLADSIATARVLIVVNYRPEFTHNWGNKTYYSQLRIDPLGTQGGDELLNALLDESPELTPLKRAIIEKTGGNPFFMEEIVKELFEQGALLRNGSIKLAKSLSTIQIPSTVQAVLASRIDRLPPMGKDLLQTLAVIGKEFSLKLITEVSAKSHDELQRPLSQLQTAEFIYEQPAASDIAYVFKHALSQQVAYGSILVERRKFLHERTARLLEAQFREAIEAQPELVARHYTEAGLAAQAIPYWQRAGERALEHRASSEAANHLRLGLELLGSLSERAQPNHTVDPAQRYSLLLFLGEALFQVGDFVEARETLVRAADVAQSIGSTESMVRAAVKLVRITYDVGLPAPEALHLLEETLQKLGREDSQLKARILGALSRYLGVTGDRKQLMPYAMQAVAMARRLGDPELIGYGLLGMFYTLMEPEHSEERLAIATELLDLARAANDINEMACGHFWRGYCLLELGDMPEADAELDAWLRWGEETNQPFYTSMGAAWRAMRASIRGHFEQAERLAQQALAIGQGLQLETAAGVFALQMFTLRREQGRLKELEAAVRFFVQQESAAATWQPGLAVIYSELGYVAEAREHFETLARHNFADLPRDSVWMGTMTYLVDVCVFLGDRARANTLYQILFPFAGRNVVVSNSVACYGALSRYLDALATTLGRWSDAAWHFEDALTINARMEARPLLAHTQHQYGKMLLARNQTGDRDEAIALLESGLATARELGMRALEERVVSALSGTSSSSISSCLWLNRCAARNAKQITAMGEDFALNVAVLYRISVRAVTPRTSLAIYSAAIAAPRSQVTPVRQRLQVKPRRSLRVFALSRSSRTRRSCPKANARRLPRCSLTSRVQPS
jgi:class 3 adenylate cyclase/tetratricopeptide (TPR) repeat protein